jgi:hypothetical protein
MVDTVDRGPFFKMLDRQALALQAKTGLSYASAFTKVYTDPANATIRDNATYEHLAQGEDAICGTRLSLIPVAKAAPAYDPLAKAAEAAEHLGPAHAKLHSMAVDHQRAHSGMSYEGAYAYLYSKPENVSLRNAVKAEHMRSTMSAHGGGELGKAAPMDEIEDDVPPGSANQEIHQLVVTHMKANPALSYERAFTHVYLAPANRSLKSRYDQESDAHMRRLSPQVRPFPAYTSPGHEGEASNVGRSGAKPRGWAGG